MTTRSHFLLTLCIALVGCAPPRGDSYRPKAGFVPDATTAIRIAEAVWTPIYGEKQVRAERPFRADLMGEIWQVYGSFPPTPRGSFYVGGTVEADMDRRTGEILRVSHGE